MRVSHQSYCERIHRLVANDIKVHPESDDERNAIMRFIGVELNSKCVSRSYTSYQTEMYIMASLWACFQAETTPE